MHTYEAPVLIKREALSAVTAQPGGAGGGGGRPGHNDPFISPFLVR